MDRRTALHYTTLLLGGTTFIGAEALLSACQPPASKGSLFQVNKEDEVLLDEVAETILPATPDAPGAKAAKAGAFMLLIVKDCYETEEQKVFLGGLEMIREQSQQLFQQTFLDLSPTQRFSLLTHLDEEAEQHHRSQSTDALPHPFTLIKQLATFAYFSSEIGTTQALRYNPIPGRFEGCVDYKPGEKAWA